MKELARIANEKWESGEKLDSHNTHILVGLKKQIEEIKQINVN